MKKVTVIRDQILLETTVPFLGKIWRVLGLGTYRTECVVQSDSRQQPTAAADTFCGDIICIQHKVILIE